MANGKIGFVVADDSPAIKRCVITTDVKYTTDYAGNVVDAFDATGIALCDIDNCGGKLASRSLDMYTGILKTQLNYSSGEDLFSVTTETFAVRHLPFACMHIITVEAIQDTTFLDVYHTITSKTNMQDIDYYNNTVDTDACRSNEGVRLLFGRGKVANHEIACVSSFHVSTTEAMCTPCYSYMGFNRVDRSDCVFGYERMRLHGMTPGKKYTILFLSTQMTDCDAAGDLMGTITKLQMRTLRDIVRVRTSHVNAWMKMWKHNVTIEPKPNVSIHDKISYQTVVRGLRRCLYNVWSLVKSDAPEGDSSPIMDIHGTMMYGGDDSVIALLTLFRMDSAKGMLDKRFDMLRDASRSASSVGLSGSMYPTCGWFTDNLGDNVRQTSMVSLAVWNFYRVTRDVHWMQSCGYTILKNNANFLLSWWVHHCSDGRDERDELEGTGDKDAVAWSTKYVAGMALLFATEASYELRTLPNENWIACFHELNELRTTNLPTEDAIVATPLLAEVMLKQNPTLDPKLLARNTLTSIEASPVDTPYSSIIKAWLIGALYNKENTAKFVDAVKNALQQLHKGTNEPCLSAMFVMMILTTVGTLRYTGNVTDTRFYTERMGFKTVPSCNMPAAWKSVKMTGVGLTKATHIVGNDNVVNIVTR